MYAEPAGFDRDALVQALRAHWDLAVASITYEPVGFGTHHYLTTAADGTTWFVNVDDVVAKAWLGDDPDTTLDALDRALRTAVALREAGLEFVHAPMPRSDGGVIAVLDGRYAVSVFGFIDGTSNPHGEYSSDEERRFVLEAVGRIHSATSAVAGGLPRRDTLAVPMRTRFLAALDDLDEPWTSGPYGEPARRLLLDRTDAVREMFERYDALAAVVARSIDTWVVTHGEPHAANVMRTSDGAIRLIDWDTAAIAPRERDLWMIEPRSDADRDAYASTSGTRELDPDAIELYRLWWSLSEITGYIDTFRAEHVEDANTRVAWRELQTYLP